jgi:hypothetical protein
MRHVLTIFIILIFTGCADRQIFKNNSGSCKLTLNKDATYTLKYPTIFKTIHEKGTYKILDSSIVLRRVTEMNYDSISDCSICYFVDQPDTLEFSFKNFNDSSICVSFTINQNSTVFKTDKSGHLKLLYRDLHASNIISNYSFYLLRISFDNKEYVVREGFTKPTNVDIKLNQFAGKKTAIIYRDFKYTKDTIIVKGLDPKAIGSNRKLIRK